MKKINVRISPELHRVKQINVRISPELHRALKLAVADKDETIQSLISNIITMIIENRSLEENMELLKKMRP